MSATDVPDLAALTGSADRFLGTVRALADDGVLSACALPEWTRADAGLVRIGTVPPVDVTGPRAVILAWLSGRGDGSGLDAGAAGLPSLPPLA